MGLMEADVILREADKFFQPLTGSQVFPKTPSGGGWWRARRTLPAGVYSPEIHYKRAALGLCELETPDELAITGGVPRCGRLMEAGSGLLRLSTLQASADVRTGGLLPWMERAVRTVYQRLDLEKAA